MLRFETNPALSNQPCFCSTIARLIGFLEIDSEFISRKETLDGSRVYRKKFVLHACVPGNHPSPAKYHRQSIKIRCTTTTTDNPVIASGSVFDPRLTLHVRFSKGQSRRKNRQNIFSFLNVVQPFFCKETFRTCSVGDFFISAFNSAEPARCPPPPFFALARPQKPTSTMRLDTMQIPGLPPPPPLTPEQLYCTLVAVAIVGQRVQKGEKKLCSAQNRY